MNIWYLTSDLLFSSRVTAQAERAGHVVSLVASSALLNDRLQQASGEAPELIVVDLTLPSLNVADVVPKLRAAAPQARILAYGPHVHTQALAAAQAAGCDVVMTNGQFDRSLGEILK